MNLFKKGTVKSGKIILTGALAAAMAVSPVASYLTVPAQAAEKTEFTEAQLAANDYVLYLANCGTSDVDTVPSGSYMGLYQGNLDQAYGEDEETGYSWGYVSDETYSPLSRGGDTTLTGSYRYISDSVTYQEGTTGIYYQFEVPEGEYEVTVGINNPWHQYHTKYEDILLEGETVESNITAYGFEEEYSVEVTDGILDVFVQSHSRSGTDDDPVLNYVIVRAVPSGDVDQLEVLQEVINNYKNMADGTYTEATKDAFDEAIENAQALVDSGSADEDAIAAAREAIETAYANLVETHITNYTSITGTNGDILYDTNGVEIQAHGGQVQKIGDWYYWIGEDKTYGYQPCPGIRMYKSQDLYNWEDCGVVLRTMTSYDQFETDDYFKALYGDLSDDEKKLVYTDLAQGDAENGYKTVIERPKMLYNESTGKYVIWFHCDGNSPYEENGDSNYSKAKAGVAIADSPEGPYTFLGSYMLASDYDDHGFDSEGGHVRDMTLFKDDDGQAYVLYSSEGNAVMYIAKLNDEYTGLVKNAEDMVLGEDFAIISTDSREAPAMFKYNGKYYLITSGCTGWAPNQAQYAVADDPLGTWTNMGNPCVGDTDNNTFNTQSTYVIPIDAENGKFIYMGDRWTDDGVSNSLSDHPRYVWLPIEFGSDNTIMIKDYSDWTLDELEGKGAISIDTDLPEMVSSIDELKEQLPETIDVTIGGVQTEDAAVEWTVDSTAEALGTYIGDVTVTGNLTDLGREFTITVFCCPEQIVYFADCYTNGDNTSEVFEKIASYADDLLNTVSDQPYGNDAGIYWGYTSTTGASGSSSSEDMGSKGSGDFFDTGWWATSNGTIQYAFELEPGNYVVSTGFQEWWSSTRGIGITVSSEDADGNTTTLGTGSASLSSSKTQDRSNVTVTVPEDSVKVYVTISKNSGSDPVLSWIGITSTDEAETTDNLVTNGSFENGKTGWSGDGSAVIEGSDAPDGSYYLRDNGDTYSWGDGSSQTVAVDPDTEYVLTGTAKVDADNSNPYWAGANVDGKEIYAVFSSDSGYTDTTDTEEKLAYQVCAGATDWTDFEIRFTTGSDTTSVNVYTWIDGGYGYLDNVVLKEATGQLDWTAFDEAVEAAQALDESDYTEKSWSAFQEVLEEAIAFKANATDDTKQREIRQMTTALTEAMDALVSVDAPVGGHIYYVDAENGDDNNDGLTPETAWQTLTKASSVLWTEGESSGGGILLKAGCTWNGEQLTVKNAQGTEEDPVVIGSYGDGAKPVVNGNGANWSSSSKEELAAVHIYNCENIVIENLEITNWDSSVSGDYTQSSKLLSGLVVENKDAGELSNVVIRNNTIHDVNGRMAGGSEKAAGGLIVVVTGGGSNHTGTVESWYNGLTIEGNEVYDVCHEAIYMESVWASRTLVGGTSSDTGYQNAGNSSWVGSSDVTISNNYVHDVAGDGIVPINTTDCIVEYNLIDNAADSNWDYTNNPNHAALWTWDTDNVTFRYNEACNTSKASIGTAVGNDSMAFDFDYGVQNCTYEYNYSHDNLGGFLMLCPGPGATVNNIARYNVSVNDGLYEGAPMIRMGTGKYGSVGVQIYNNTMYWEDSGYASALTPDSYWEGSVIEDVAVFNNIFYGPATSDSVSTQSGITYYNNLVYSSDGSAQEVYQAAANDENAVYEDPMFADVTDYTSGTWTDGETTLGTADGFQIQEGSPAIDAGAEHPDAPASSTSSIEDELVPNETGKPLYDYYGTALTDGTNDIGANEYTEEEVTELRIVANPEDVSGAAGENAVFTVEAEGTGLSYQWQYANAGSDTWRASSMSGNDTPEITVPIASYRDGQKYRCVVTDRDGNSVTSESATITMIIPDGTPVIITQPEDFIGTAGEMAVFEVEAEGTGLSYQWQYANAGSNTWRNSSMEGNTTDSLSVEIASYRDGQKYRCVVTSESGYSVTSDAAEIIIGVPDDAPQIISQPEDFTGAVGETAIFEVEAEGEGLSYQWQYCNADSTVWRTSSMKGNGSAKLEVPVTTARDGQKYRCVITSATGRVVTTETVVLSVTSD